MSSQRDFQWGRATGSESGHAGSAQHDRAVQSLREALQAERRIIGWRLEQARTRSSQLYLARTEIEAIRHGDAESVRATIYVERGGKVGTAAVELEPGEEADAARKVSDALAQAASAEVDRYPLPGAAKLPAVAIEDPDIARDPENVLERTYAQLIDLAAAERNLRLASAEIFLDHEAIWLENSEGLRADRTGTRVTAEVVVIGLGENQSEAEVQGLRYRRRVQDLDLAEWVADLASQARDATRTRAVELAGIPVVIVADSVSAFLQPFQSQSSAESAFQEVTTWKPGTVISAQPPKGDRLTLYADATLSYGNQSAPCDGDGVPAQRTLVIENGVLKQYWATARYAHYLKIPATGQFSNWAINGGSQSAAALLAGGPVLEVKRFSWLNPNGATGDFASEIRFGYLHRNGERIPVKGGSVAGNVFEAFADCQISRETRFMGDGQVPAAIRFHSLSTLGA